MTIHWDSTIQSHRQKPLPWKICFYCNNIQKWSSASLISVLQTDDRLKNAFTPSVFIAPETFNGKQKRMEQFRQLKDFFGNDAIEGYDAERDQYCDFPLCDIAVYNQPWDMPKAHECAVLVLNGALPDGDGIRVPLRIP